MSHRPTEKYNPMKIIQGKISPQTMNFKYTFCSNKYQALTCPRLRPMPLRQPWPHQELLKQKLLLEGHFLGEVLVGEVPVGEVLVAEVPSGSGEGALALAAASSSGLPWLTVAVCFGAAAGGGGGEKATFWMIGLLKPELAAFCALTCARSSSYLRFHSISAAASAAALGQAGAALTVSGFKAGTCFTAVILGRLDPAGFTSAVGSTSAAAALGSSSSRSSSRSRSVSESMSIISSSCRRHRMTWCGNEISWMKFHCSHQVFPGLALTWSCQSRLGSTFGGGGAFFPNLAHFVVSNVCKFILYGCPQKNVNLTLSSKRFSNTIKTKKSVNLTLSSKRFSNPSLKTV